MEKPIIRKVTLSDLRYALCQGMGDFLAAPQYGLFFGGIFAAGGILLALITFLIGQAWLAYPLIIGFSLIGPFIAAGLYEVSRLLEIGERPTWSGVLGVVWNQQRRELGWMAFVVLFVFWIWIYQIRTLVALFFGFSGFANFDGFLDAVFLTQNGWNFLIVGHLVGAIISLTLFSVTVISCPLLLEKEMDFVTAMVTSIKTVLKSPIAMFLWGGLVIVSVLVSAAFAFLGLLLTLPILGHATWHLYRRAIAWG